MRRLFGTDGIRGTANQEPMTSELAMRLGRAAAYIFKNKSGRHRIVIGKDTRLSGYMLESALTSGICSMGVDVLLVGPFPTPGIAFLTRSLRADAGVVISASHNAFEDNGIKFFSKDGFKLPDEAEKEIEDLIFSSEIDHVRPTATGIGKAYRIDDAEGRYIEFAKNSFPKDMNLEGFKVVVDCANGAAYKIMPMILKELGAEVIVIGDKPDGLNINLDCGSLHPEKVQKIVIDHGADIGISHDGDADRAIFSCEEGGLVDGDQVMAACAIAMKRNGMLKGDTLITTTMSNLGLEIAMKQHGIRLIRTQVGDRYVMDEIISGGYNLGGEQSGHIIFYDHNTTGDGIITALQVLALMKKTGRRLSDLASSMVRLPQILINVKIREKVDLDSIDTVKGKVDKIKKRLGDSGRLLIRYSGTEPLVRIMIEGLREDEIRVMAEDLAVAIKGSIGA